MVSNRDFDDYRQGRWPGRPCPCGSGHDADELVDAAGIYITMVCDACVVDKARGYRLEVFDAHSVYAGTGVEEDLIYGD